jgi:hypothetical protein
MGPGHVMDMKKLVVGQKVWMQSGSLFKEATVTEITDKCIEAKPVHFGEKERPWLIRFREDGKQLKNGERRGDRRPRSPRVV